MNGNGVALAPDRYVEDASLSRPALVRAGRTAVQ